MKSKARACELCKGEASLYCAADSAFLCRSCDAKVHGANFLVARHFRQSLCCKCSSLTGNFVSGSRSRSSVESVCHSCSQDEKSFTSSSDDSDCISTTESSAEGTFIKLNDSNRSSKGKITKISASSSVTDDSGGHSGIPVRIPEGIATSRKKESERKPDSNVEGIFVIWCRRLGLSHADRRVVSMACQAFKLCWENLTTFLPLRVTLAVSFWLGLKMCGGDPSAATCINLKRVGEISGVPTKLIVAVESRLSRVTRIKKRSARKDLKEGWAECDT